MTLLECFVRGIYGKEYKRELSLERMFIAAKCYLPMLAYWLQYAVECLVYNYNGAGVMTSRQLTDDASDRYHDRKDNLLIIYRFRLQLL